MTDARRETLEERVLVLAPTRKDADLIRSVLERADVACVCCADLNDLCEKLNAGAGALLLAEEALAQDHKGRLAQCLAGQPPWSDLPVLVLVARRGTDSAGRPVATADDVLGNVTALERPMSMAALVSAVRTALRARRRQYQTRAHLAQLERSEGDLRDFFENSSVGLHWVGPDGIIQRVNQAELDLLGYRREEYVGRHVAEFHVNRVVIEDILARLARGETVRECPARLRAKNGAVLDVLISASALVENGKLVHSRCFTHDVTERKRAERGLRTSETRLAAEADALATLHELSSRLWGMRGLRQGLDEMLAATLELLGADVGYVQLVDRQRGVLVLAAQRGFDADFSEVFREVDAADDSACGQALRSRQRVVIENVDDEAPDAPLHARASAAGCRAVQATPLIGRDGTILGMLSTHFREVSRPSDQDLRRLDLYVRQAVDFIERCATEESLRENERRLGLALEAGRMGSWEWSLKTNRVVWSPGLEAIHGLEPGTFAGTFAAFEQDVHPDDVDKVSASIARSLQTGDEHHVEYRIIRPDASVHWVEGRGSVVRDQDGVVVGMVGVCIDVTQRKQAESIQALLAAIVASSDDAIVSKTLEGKILTWNAGAERIFGYTAAEAIGRPIMMLIPPERHGEEAELLDRLGRGEHIEHFETVRVAKDGRRLDVSLTVSPVRDNDGRIIAASKVARDVTQNKQAAEALRAVQEQLQVVTDNMAVAVTRCSRDLRYLWISPGCAAWLGRRVEDVVGKPIQEVIGAAAFEAIRGYVTRVLAGERVEFEAQVPYQELGMRWVKGVYVPTHDQSGQTDGWVAVITDTTAHHEMEEALREADRRKDEFLAVLAHELRNPLAPIRNSLHILSLSTRHDPTAARVGEMMERQVNHVVRLVDDLMEVSRITRGKIELRKELVEVAAVVRSAVETSQPLIDAAGHQLALALPPEPLLVEGDPVRLAQILANLLNNAAKYTDPGGQIWLTARREGREVALVVRDNGSGIPPDLLPRVFELFTQLDRHTGRSDGGLGIGLTLVKRLVEMHGGSVRAHSDGPGCGSEFVVRLPLAFAATTTRAATPAPSATLAPRRVLVVDDNRDAAESLAMLLRMLGAEVQVKYNGPDALAVLADYQPAVVLLDIGMPGMDGHEVARRIRQTPEFRDVKLIALTGWGLEEDRRRSQSAGFDHHLIKPADAGALQTLLTSLETESGR